MASIKKIKSKGFTLIEMILYVAICSMLLLSLSTMFSFLLGSRVKSQAITEVNQQGFFVMHLLTSSIRNAKSVDTPAMSATSPTLSITTQSPLLSPTVIGTSNQVIVLTEGAATALPITNSRISVSSLLFENISSSSSTDRVVRISYTLTYKSASLRQEYSYSKTFTGSATLRQ
ncbi:MAG: prepilin-type N-terminal cleavage/methylation domain-containing protein [Candidatus Pacebacteria bacterium]|nr:prepilin-type N-terminal cleavage/methylation domain-containing protein [Candidatus Paceibacterota bacterium]